MRKKYCLLLFVVLLWSCAKEEIINIKMQEPKLVLSACLSPEQEISAYLSKTFGSGEDNASSDLKNKASINVFVNNEFKGSMIFVEPDTTDKSGYYESKTRQYTLPGVIPSAGDEVRFEAESAGYERISAKTKIPGAPELISIDTVRYQTGRWNEEKIRFYVRMKDEPRETNYYRIFLNGKIKSEDEESFPHSDIGYDYGFTYSYGWSVDYEDPVFTADLPFYAVSGPRINNYGIFADNLFGGKEYTLKLSGPTMFYYGTSYNEIRNFKCLINLLAVSDAYYNYYKQSNILNFVAGSIQLTSSGDNINSYSNVENGFGLVFSYNKTFREIEIEQGLIEDREN